MAIVETLEVRFQANMGRLSDQLNALAGQISGLSSALDGGRISLAENAAELIAAVAQTLYSGAGTSALPGEAGALLAGNFSRGVALGAADASESARSVVQSARFESDAALQGAIGAGTALGQGFAEGIESSRSAVMRAANRIASAAVRCIRSALSIHSPSKVSFELGGNFGKGFAEGVDASIRSARQSAAALSRAGVQGLSLSAPVSVDADQGGVPAMMQQAVSQALGGVNLVLPLYVDGMKLGEASIRGINRVTRSTGRLMLEI